MRHKARKKKVPKPPPKIDESYLAEEARTYLARYSSSSKRVKTVLQRRVRKSVDFHGGHWSEHEPAIERVIAAMVKYGMIDDDRLAKDHAVTLHRKGYSRVVIRQKLNGYQFPRDSIDLALEELEEEGNTELDRACAYVRRRRLGVFRYNGARDFAQQRKDLQSMGRAGFAYGLSKQLIACQTEEEFLLVEEGVED